MKILKIAFISKPKSKTLTKGIAKYIINEEGLILDEWCELLQGTELRGKNKYGTKFDKKVIEFRKKIMIDFSKTEILNQTKLLQINKYFYHNLKTILNHDKFTTGSNPSGSDYKLKATPYLIYGGIYNQYMFLNFFKKLRRKSYTNFRNSGLEELTLDQYFKLFPNIKNNFNNFNKIIFTALEDNNLNKKTLNIDNSDDSSYIIDLIISPYYKTYIEDESEKNKDRILKLRRIFKNRLRKVRPSDHLFGKLPEDMCEAAHIFPVSEIKKLELSYWYMIADENNGLNLPTQIHKLYDNNKIYFDEKGNIIFTNQEYKNHLSLMFSKDKKYRIFEKLLNKKRKMYIKKYNQDILNI